MNAQKNNLGSAAMSAAVTYALEALETRRFLSAGQLDSTFGIGGRVMDQSLPAALAVAVQTDGRVVEVGQMLGNFEVARFNSDGTADTSFGYLGRLITDLGGADLPSAVAIQADGKILASGLSDGKFALTRYQSNGQLDNAFGTGGIVRTGFASEAAQSAFAALRPDGKIVMVGAGAGTRNSYDVLLARYNPNGTFDNTFGTGGEIISADPSRVVFGINSIALQPDGRIMVAGSGFENLQDWKIRFKINSEKMLTGSLLQIAEVFKQLVRLQAEKPLSFREKKMLDRTRTMLISEVSQARNISEPEAISLIQKSLGKAGYLFPEPA